MTIIQSVHLHKIQWRSYSKLGCVESLLLTVRDEDGQLIAPLEIVKQWGRVAVDETNNDSRDGYCKSGLFRAVRITRLDFDGVQ